MAEEIVMKPPRRTVYDMIHESVPRKSRGNKARKLAAIAKRLKAKRRAVR